uniref:Uncharacterized protein n=1 Tax=Nelumbo nucifera TaxID=4432 RepID=A0A822YZI8_NELNU|nr:TPA_asm: hypothetical protein HUJ06_006806 [Nelumbo nucifera]
MRQNSLKLAAAALPPAKNPLSDHRWTGRSRCSPLRRRNISLSSALAF